MTPTEKSPKRLRILKSKSTNDQSKDSVPKETKPVPDASCPRCFGTGIEIVAGEGARRCDCQTSDHLNQLFQNARIPARYQHCTLANYEETGDGSPESISRWKAKGE